MGKLENIQSCTPWYLDKKIALTFIASLFFNSASLVWYASQFNSRLLSVEKTSGELMTWKDHADEQRTRLEVQLGSLSQNVSDNTKVLDHIQMLIEKHMEGK